MASHSDETLLFVVEWYDPLPQLKKTYLLKYFVDQHMVEMIDVKSKKAFLKKTQCPKEVAKEDFYIGGKVLLFSRELEFVDYGDVKTKEKLQYQAQQSVVILPAEMYSDWGKIISDFSKRFTLIKIKSVLMPHNIADNVCRILEESSRRSSTFSQGVALILIFSGEDGHNQVRALSNSLEGRYGKIYFSSNGMQTSELQTLLFDRSLPTSATLDSCTCCVIKPHAVKEKLVGAIVDMIIGQGYEISAMRTVLFDKIQAEEFLEVYKGVVPEYSDHVIQLCSGLSVAMEIRAQDAVETFRQSAGPWDIEMAKELRHDTIRGRFGKDRIQSAVHCTDLATDGELECEYCFKLV